jgi:hypothetical protein
MDESLCTGPHCGRFPRWKRIMVLTGSKLEGFIRVNNSINTVFLITITAGSRKRLSAYIARPLAELILFPIFAPVPVTERVV